MTRSMIIDLSGAAWDFSNACIARVCIRVLGACSYVAWTCCALHVAFHVTRVAMACCRGDLCFDRGRLGVLPFS